MGQRGGNEQPIHVPPQQSRTGAQGEHRQAAPTYLLLMCPGGKMSDATLSMSGTKQRCSRSRLVLRLMEATLVRVVRLRNKRDID